MASTPANEANLLGVCLPDGVLASMWLPSHDKYARRMQVLVLHVPPPLDVTLTQQMLPVAPQEMLPVDPALRDAISSLG